MDPRPQPSMGRTDMSVLERCERAELGGAERESIGSVNRVPARTLTAATPPLSMKSKIPIPAIDLATKCAVYKRGGLTAVRGGSLATANKCAAVLMVTKT